MFRAGQEPHAPACVATVLVTFTAIYPPPANGESDVEPPAGSAAEPGGETRPSIVPLDAVGSEERPPVDGRPWVLSNMIASADGATTVDGLSGGLGGPADAEVFAALRSVADAIVVGASTVRLEDYRPPGPGTEAAAAARAARGQAPRPLLVIVTASLGIDREQRSLIEADYRPLIATVTDAPADRRESLAERADLIECGTGQVSLPLLMTELGRRGHRVVLSEGGPSLNGQLVADDLIDEWNLTVSPILAGGNSKRPAQGQPLQHPSSPMRLRRVWQAHELLFCRWTRG